MISIYGIIIFNIIVIAKNITNNFVFNYFYKYLNIINFIYLKKIVSNKIYFFLLSHFNYILL